MPEKIELPIDKNEATPTNPDLSWGWKMLLIFIWVIAFAYLVFLWFSRIILANIDLETEKKWFWDKSYGEKFDYKKYITDYKIDEFNKINFYIEDSPKVNAFTVIWWNILVTTWLLEDLENQEELVFILAHEMGHIVNRDVMKKLTTEIPMKLTLSFLGFDISSWDLSALDVSWNFISKDIEAKADDFWLKILEKYKINPLCAEWFFKRDHNLWNTLIELIWDHPTNLSRIQKMENLAQKMWFKDTKNCKKIKNNVK